MTCGLYRTFEAGDHVILVGKVNDGEAAGGDPLVFFLGQYEALTVAAEPAGPRHSGPVQASSEDQ